MTTKLKDVDSFFTKHKLKPPIGCASSEIDDLERKVGFQLPNTYRAYLEFMGRDYKGVMKGSDCFIDHALENTECLPDLLEENQCHYQLPEHYLAFFCHQGYAIAWFELPTSNENPTCFLYDSSGKEDTPKACGEFSQFITTCIIDTAKKELAVHQNTKWWRPWK